MVVLSNNLANNMGAATTPHPEIRRNKVAKVVQSNAQSEDDLLLAMVSGDVRAARELSDRLTPRVYGHAFRVLGNTAQAEDVTQEALLRLWKAAPGWRTGEAKISTWLYRVTANLCTDVLRAQRPMDDKTADLIDETPSAVQRLTQKSRLEALQAALLELPERQRQAVVLRHLEGLQNPEIAAILEITVEAVESLTARGKRALANILKPQKNGLGYEGEGV